MRRRRFLGAAAAAGTAALPAAETGRAILELRYYRMRNGEQVARTQEFLGKHFAPAAARAGIAPLGFFGAVVAPEAPFILVLKSYPSLAAMAASMEKLEADKEFARASEAYNSPAEPNFIRAESSLLRAFDSVPRVEVPPAESGRPPRIFELRTYRSNSFPASRRKIRMFNDGEVAIFRRVGILPVFFGETIVGAELPNLTYMVAFDDMAERDKAWRAFGSDPEWQKLRATPGLSDAQIVSNISNSILRPMPFSQIR